MTSIKVTCPALAIVIVLALYLLLTSTFFPPGFLSVFDGKRVLQLVLFSGATVFAATWRPLRIATISQLRRLTTLNRVALVLFFLLGLVSALRLDHPAYALVDVSMLFVMLLLTAVTAASRNLAGRRFDQWAVSLLAVLGLVVAVQELMGFVAGWVSGFEFNYTQSFMHFAHPRFYNQLQTWSIPLLAALPLVFPNRRWLRFACTALLGLQWFLVIAVAARGTAVSLLSAMVLMAFWLPGQRKSWLNFQLRGLLLGVTIYSIIFFLNGLLLPGSRTGEFYAHSIGRPMVNTSGRSLLWRLAAEDAIEHPVLGAGPTRFACRSEMALPAHPHSFLFRIAGEWGILAGMLLILLVISIGLDFLKRLNQLNNTGQTGPPLRAITGISLVAGAIHASLSGLLMMPASQVAMLLTAGWCLSLSGNDKPTSKPWVLTGVLVFAGAIFSLATLVFAAQEIPRLAVRTRYSESYGPAVPGFWQNGRACKYTYQSATRND